MKELSGKITDFGEDEVQCCSDSIPDGRTGIHTGYSRGLFLLPDAVQGVCPGVVLVFVTPDPVVKGGNGDLPVFAELYNSEGTLRIGILLKDGEYERQCISREGDDDLGEYGMQVIPVMVAGPINAFAAFFAEIDGNLNGVHPGCSVVRPDKTT